MASEVLLPLTKQFRTASASIEYVRRYIGSIRDPDVRAQFEAESGERILGVQAPLGEGVHLRSIKTSSPRAPRRCRLRKDQERVAADRVRPLVTQAEKLLDGIKVGGRRRAWKV